MSVEPCSLGHHATSESPSNRGKDNLESLFYPAPYSGFSWELISPLNVWS
jgi:hypothetical protein